MAHAFVRRAARIGGTLLIAAGCLTLVWAIVVWRWQDPFTALYTHFEQEHLARQYRQETAAFRPRVRLLPHPHEQVAGLKAAEKAMAADAGAYDRSLKVGGPVGRLTIGRIGLHMIVVQGTDEQTLKKGPGHYLQSALPGEGRLIYVAGHRTTYLAPFSRINDIRTGDYITFELPYGTFTYRAFRHYIVRATDLSVLVNHGREILRLQACHPRFFATHRYILDARLVYFVPRGSKHHFSVASSSVTGARTPS